MNKYVSKFFILIFLAALTACGSDSETTDTNSPTSINASIEGTAAKGIIISGLVTAVELDSTGADLTEVGSAVTDANGHYSLQLNASYQGGPISLRITSGANTTMVCDIPDGCGTRTDNLSDADNTIDFGEQYKLATLSMQALLPEAEDGESLDVQITPFTHMAALKALNSARIDATTIETANLLVSNLLGGIDILRTPPIDITDSASISNASAGAVVYAALNASIGVLAPRNAADSQPDINAAIATLAGEFLDGSITASDVASDDSTIALDEIVQGAEAAISESGSTDTSGVLAELNSDIAAAGSGGYVTPETPVHVGDSDVAKAKAFFVDLRTWAVTIEGEIGAPTEAFALQLDMAEAADEMIEDEAIGEALGLAILAIVEKINDSTFVLTDLAFEDDQSTPFSAGSLTQTTTDDGEEFSISDAEVIVNDTTVDVEIVVVLPADGSTVSALNFGIKSADVESSAFKLVIGDGTVSVTLAGPFTLDFSEDQASEVGLEEEEASPVVSAIAFDFDLSVTQKLTVSESDELETAADPVTFRAAISSNLHVFNDEEGDVIGLLPGSFTASGTVSNATGDSFEIALSGSIPGAAELESIGVDDDGELEFFGESQPLVANVGLGFEVQLDNSPAASINIIGNATGFDLGNASFTISFGQRKLAFIAANDNDIGDEVSFVITNQHGVKLAIAAQNLNDEIDDNETSIVTIDGKKVADVIDLDNGLTKVAYIDGTFEIF